MTGGDRHDIVLYGATGFTGRQAAATLAASPRMRGLSWAIAGRSRDRLERIAAGLERPPDVLVADSARPETIDAMVARARVLATTVGPYARHGDPVVDACVRHRTAYVDITGETTWVRRLIDRHHERAAADGTRIVPFCGYDSVPSDLGALLVVDFLRRTMDQGCREVLAVHQAAGGLNGGTLATALALFETGDSDALADPVLLSPPGHRTDAHRRGNEDPRRPFRHPDLGRWVAPFFMGPINTRVVRRSAALLEDAGSPYGPRFRYQEGQLAGRRLGRLEAGLVAGGLALFERAMARPAFRRLAARIGPSPGDGPAESTMDGGFFRTILVGTACDGSKVRVTLEGQGDPGNRITVLILCQAALCLATEADRLPTVAGTGGILTPATAFGRVLADRLVEAGISIDEAVLAPQSNP